MDCVSEAENLYREKVFEKAGHLFRQRRIERWVRILPLDFFERQALRMYLAEHLLRLRFPRQRPANRLVVGPPSRTLADQELFTVTLSHAKLACYVQFVLVQSEYFKYYDKLTFLAPEDNEPQTAIVDFEKGEWFPTYGPFWPGQDYSSELMGLEEYSEGTSASA